MEPPGIPGRFNPVDASQLLRAVVTHCHTRGMEVVSVNESLLLGRARYEFPGAETWGRAEEMLSPIAEPIGSFINPYGRNPYVELSFVVSPLQPGRSSLKISATFKTWGEPGGRGGVGPFAMNSKGVWEPEFLDSLRATFATAPVAPSTLSGTGFLIGKSIVVTASHVVAGRQSIHVHIGSDAGARAARIVATDEANDLAVLRIAPPTPGPALPLILDRQPAIGTRVYVLGFSFSEVLGGKLQIVGGLVSSTSGPGGDPRFLQLDAGVNPGMSGGPVVDEHGQVIGVVSTRLQPTIAESVSFAMKSTLLLPVIVSANLDSVDTRFRPEMQSPPLTATEIYENVAASVVHIRAQ